MLNEHQAEQNTFGVLALQKSVNGLDFQLAAFSRYSTLHFVPDTIGDLVFNGIASDVYRRGFANGLQGDGAYRLTDAHTLRAGFTVDRRKHAEQQYLDSAAACRRRSGRRAVHGDRRQFEAWDGSPASTSRTNGRSPTN